MGIFSKITGVVLAPITIVEKTIDRTFDSGLYDEYCPIKPSDMLTCGITTVAKGIKKVAKEIDRAIDED